MMGWYDGDGIGSLVLVVLMVLVVGGALVATFRVLVRSSTGDPRHEAPVRPSPRHEDRAADDPGEVDEGQFVHSRDELPAPPTPRGPA